MRSIISNSPSRWPSRLMGCGCYGVLEQVREFFALRAKGNAWGGLRLRLRITIKKQSSETTASLPTQRDPCDHQLRQRVLLKKLHDQHRGGATHGVAPGMNQRD